MASSRCLVTGGAGFIGSHIVDKLIGAGHQVVCLDNFDDYYDVSIKEKNIERFKGLPAFELVKGSILEERDLKKSLAGADYVFHIAARAGIRESIRNPIVTHRVNATGTLMVLKYAMDAGVKKVIFSSSSSVYGNASRLPVSEDEPARPISPYGVSKLCAENYCEVYHRVHGLDSAILRYFTVYGPRMRPDLAISVFTRKALEGRAIEVFGDGMKSRDFTHVDDAVDATVRAMRRGSGVYNVGSGKAVTIDGLARMIVEKAGSGSVILHREGAPGDMEHTLADISRARRDLGYVPRTDFAEGVGRYVEYVRAGRRA